MLRTTTAIAAILFAGSAYAQDVFENQGLANDQIDDIQQDVADDFARTADARDFGRNRNNGSYGSVSLTGTGTSGNTDIVNIGLGSRFGFTDGPNGHDFALSYLFSRESGDDTANEGAASYEYTRSFNNDFYGFGEVTARYDDFGSFEQDIFVGAGVGYRIINTSNVTWSVQGGPGFRYVKYNEDQVAVGDDDEFSEAAGILSSKFYRQIGENAQLTNELDVLFSESDTAVISDLGLTVALNNQLAMRTSLLTEYHSDPLNGQEDTDHAVGLSLVYSFR